MLSNTWNRHFNLVVLAVILVGLAIGAAAASVVTKPPPAVVAQPAPGANGFAAGQGALNGNGQGAAGGQAAGALAGRGVFGSVSSVDAKANTMTVSGQQGDTKVALSGAHIVKTVDGAATDLQAGQRVTVVGQQQSDGSYNATSVQILPADQAQRGAGAGQAAGAGGGAQGATSQGQGSAQAGGGSRPQGQQGGGGFARPLTGSVTSVADGVLVVNTQQGDVKVKLAGARIEKSVDGAIGDLQAGQRVVVTGQANPDGSYAATEVQITPANGNNAQPQQGQPNQPSQQGQQPGQQRQQSGRQGQGGSGQ